MYTYCMTSPSLSLFPVSSLRSLLSNKCLTKYVIVSYPGLKTILQTNRYKTKMLICLSETAPRHPHIKLNIVPPT